MVERKRTLQHALGKQDLPSARLKPVWKSNAYSRATKLRIYKSNVLPVLLYGAECWRMTAKDLSRLSTFHTTCLRRIMRVFWPNRISNSDLLEATKQETMNNIFKRKRWRWIGHTLRMEPSVHARIALTWTPEGRRKRERPRCTWRRTMLGELKEAGMVWSAAVKRAQDRNEWRDLVEALCAPRHEEVE